MIDLSRIPQLAFGRLYHDVQMSGLFEDSKTFADAIPRSDPPQILAEYLELKDTQHFDLSAFLRDRFVFEEAPAVGTLEPGVTVEDHIAKLWHHLTRDGRSEAPFSSRIPIPGRYVVPGGRFQEIYYWDSYFTMLGLVEHDRCDLATDMVAVFSSMIERFGFVPNGNRQYYLSRSQPPFLSSMVALLDERCGGIDAASLLRTLQLEYSFWMRGHELCREPGDREARCVNVDGSGVLNRYWDELAIPRDESYREDHRLASTLEDPESFYRNIRAACESGWDFSSRWLGPDASLASIRTTEIVPFDLNCVLLHLEEEIAALASRTGDDDRAVEARRSAEERRRRIGKIFWDENTGCFTDFDLESRKSTRTVNAATSYPLFFGVATRAQAARVAEVVERQLLEPGGVNTTTNHTGQQWDAPNGWAPLQWITVRGLADYGYPGLAREIASRWIRSVDAVFRRTGKIVEKYDVEKPDRPSGGGEYPTQDGFGWTNGVYLALKRFLAETA